MLIYRIIVVTLDGIWVPMINPEIYIVDNSKFSLAGEGCLSRPGVHRKMRRAKRIIVRFTGEDDDQKEHMLRNRMAAAVAHEVDHLDGKFI